MCHYRHYAHDDPFYLPGLQDITAHVDFTAITDAATTAGLEVALMTRQAKFLIDSGITDLLGQVSPKDVVAYLPLANQVQRLLSPAEMGELFKVVVLEPGS
jgi:SAM-dependent MidA family methyltransferase